MKLIEKLAEEYSWTPEQQRIWMDGFRKAREMSIAEARWFAKEERTRFVNSLPPGVSAPLVLQCEALTFKLEQLGEEEV
jgi:hypothetical protein